MKILPFGNSKKTILAPGAESAGIFAVYRNGNIFISKSYGDLLDNASFLKYKREVLAYLKKEKIKSDVIITDLHPLYNSTALGEELAKGFKAEYIKTQHHIAHIFSAVGDFLLKTNDYGPITDFIGIASDGTGYGLDGNMWGGEAFRIKNYESRIMNKKNKSSKTKNFTIERIGSLEEQIMIGGDLAVKEPARMLLTILAKLQILNAKRQIKEANSKIINTKEGIYKYVKKYYSRNEFELLYNQLEQNFNCQKTSSTGRILDAVSVLLGFAVNERKYKHEAVKKLEENSTIPYNIEPIINPSIFPLCKGGLRGILQITPLFEYLIKNYNKDKRRLAATAQLYIAKGFYEMIQPLAISHKPLAIFAAGGMTNNKIISQYLEKNGVYISKKIPRGDEGVAFGQIIFYLAKNRRGWE